MIFKIFFIKPMRKKYDIMDSNLKEIKYFYVLELIGVILSILYFVIIFLLNKTYFFTIITIYIVISIIYYFKIKRYNILKYINHYSEDLFDWHKIYNLNIDEEIKKQCFVIHNKNYDNFK
jgi:hypothetical protein